MPSFLKDISKFYGTGEKNASGQTLEEFLDVYDPYKYKTPSCTTDAVIFSYEGEMCKKISDLKVLLVRRSNHPSIGCLALPGGFAELGENLEDTARRELEEETGVKGLIMEQLATYGDYDRDPRTRVITTAYMALVRQSEVKVQAGDDAADAMWCDVDLEEVSGDGADIEINEEIRREKKNGTTVYRLVLQNEERRLRTEAYVKRVSAGGMGIIREEKFRVIRQGETASDHAAIIVQALLKIEDRMEE